MECEVSCPRALLKLCTSLTGLTSTQQQIKLNKYMSEWTGAEIAFIVPVEQHERESLSMQVIGTTVRELRENPAESVIRKELEKLATSQVSFTDDLTMEQFQELKKLLGCDIHSFLSVPIPNPQEQANTTKKRRTSSFFQEDTRPRGGEVISNGVAAEREAMEAGEASEPLLIVCLANRKTGGQFGSREVAIVRECFQVCVGGLQTSMALEEELSLKAQLQKLLTVAKNLFSHLGDVTVLLRQIMAEARRLTQAERCSLFLVDRQHSELVAKVFDGIMLPDGTVEQQPEVRLPLGTGIAGHVATTGKLVNIKDAYHHPLFYKGCDEETGFKTRNILCFPINDEDRVIGVAELCNKLTNTHFTKFDEEMAMAFSSYCGLAILHSLMYKKVADAQYRSKLSNELMMYHMKVPDEEVTHLVSSALPSTREIHPDFAAFSFFPRVLPIQDSTAAVFSIFSELGMIQRWRIDRHSLGRFLLMVRRGYRDPPYHNWSHAFSVAQFAFLLLSNLGLLAKGIVSELEAFALVIACLCHDLDHRGTNNTFQISSNSVLAALYSSEGSVMERHHFAQSMCILNTEGCNILDNLSKADYTNCLDLIRDNILSTDLAHHLRMLPEMERMVTEGVRAEKSRHHYLTSCLLMTASDLSDQTKDWLSTKKIAQMVYTEFFTQGDLEKAMGNKPTESMDRERACIPSLQIQFIDHIVVPVYKTLALLDPGAEEPYQGVLVNRTKWSVAGKVLADRGQRHKDVMDIFQDDLLDQEVERIT